MIYVTHDQIEAMSMGDRIVVMKDGVVHQVDTPLNIYHHPINKFVASFIGSPTMNFMQGSLVQNGSMKFMQERSNFSIGLAKEVGAKLASYGKPTLTIGIRPEHIFSSPPAGSHTLSPFKAIVEVVEPVGNEIFVYFSTGTDAQYVARVASDRTPEVGKPLDMYFDTSKIHLFDKDSEQTI